MSCQTDACAPTSRSKLPASPALSFHRYGFNAGSTQCFYGCMSVAASIAVNTTLATGGCQVSCGLYPCTLLAFPRGARDTTAAYAAIG